MPKAHINGIQVNYSTHGQGHPLVLIMGLGMDSSGWMFQVPELKKHFRVITLDNRGCGLSDKPPGPYSTRVMAQDVIGLLDFLQVPRAHVVGDSMGGMIAQEVALGWPQRVAKLVLACTYSRPDPLAKTLLEQGMKTMIGEVRDLKTVDPKKFNVQAIAQFMLPLVLSKEFYEKNKALLIPFMEELLKKASVEGFLGQVVATQEHDTFERLPQITVPTLVMTGTHDALVHPKNSEVLSSRIPGARLVRIEGGSHGFNFEKAAEFNRAIIEFLGDGATRVAPTTSKPRKA
ncbi:MAG: alpha/beta fold hydrolase [Euryarchaeota archaeon]|nr:alpha/beta fold hydrolase [Euryarchaeota archaeon]